MTVRGSGRGGGSRRYSAEERAEAVRIVRSSPTRTSAEIARELGIPKPTLHRWVAEAKDLDVDPTGSLSETARRRIRVLEEENARLRRDLEFEKKAKAFIRDLSRRQHDSR